MKIVHGAVVVSLVAGCASGGAAPPSGPGPAQGAHEGHGHGHGPGHGHGHHGQGMQHRFDGAEGWAKVFDAEDRDAWQKPDEVLSAMGLDKGGKGTELVADVGAGTGYFSVKIAKRVPSGKVFAVDVEGDMVRYLKERATREGLTNLVAVQSTADDPKIPEPVDVVLVVDTLHHIGAREAYFKKLRASLRPGGRVVIVDFHAEATMGPPKEHRLSVDDVVAEAKASGLVKRSESRLPQQYVLVLTAQ